RHGDGSPIFRSKLQMTFLIQVSGWYWARKFYWNVPGAMPDAFVEDVAAQLLQCQSSDVPDLLGQSPRPLQCGRCCDSCRTLSSEEYRQAIHVDEQLQSTFLCPNCRGKAS